jgi:hypothetical protein
MADDASKWDIVPSSALPARGLAFSSPSESRAFPTPYIEAEQEDTKVPRISGGVSTKLGRDSSVDVGVERIPTDVGASYGGSVSFRKKF